MAISAAVQKVIDDIAANTSLSDSILAALGAESTQITALGAQITALQAQLNAGTQIGPEDLAALATAASDLEATNTKLTAAVPASTPPATPPAA